MCQGKCISVAALEQYGLFLMKSIYCPMEFDCNQRNPN